MKKFNKIFTVLVYIFLYAPILVLIVFSFNSTKSTIDFTGFTLKWYRELFTRPDLLKLLMNTLIIAVIASVVSTVLGTMAAVGISFMKRRSRSMVLTATNIPMTNPDIVTGVSLALLFVFAGTFLRINDVFGFWTLLIAHITFCLPYVILSVLPKIKQMDKNLTDAALDLGCTPTQSFFKIMLPEILPGIISGATMAFTLSLDDFVISYFVYGASFSTLPIEIYSYTKKPMPPTVFVLFTIMFTVIFLLLFFMNMAEYKKSKKKKIDL